MLGLLALEAWRHQAIVVGENLGTVPDGFNQGLQEKGMLGMSVLWFQRGVQADAAGSAASFTAPSQWPSWSMAMPTTHDLTTIAGWWGGRDLYWRERLGRFSEGGQRLQAVQQRESEKKALWKAKHTARCLSGATANARGQVR